MILLDVSIICSSETEIVRLFSISLMSPLQIETPRLHSHAKPHIKLFNPGDYN